MNQKEKTEKLNKLIHRFMSKDQCPEDLSTLKYHQSWDWLIPAYNSALLFLKQRPDVQEILNREENMVAKFGMTHFFGAFEGQYHINSSWLKLGDFCTFLQKYDLK